MLLLPTCVLTAVLATAVSATTVLPSLAFDSGHLSITATPSIGQTVLGLQIPTIYAPAVMLPAWQGSERHLYKRAPIGMEAVTAEVDFEKRGLSKYLPFTSHGKFDPAGTISDQHALEAPTKLTGFHKMRKQYKDDLHHVAFREQKGRETFIYAPLRRLKTFGSHLARKAVGHIVKVYNKEKGNEMLARVGDYKEKVDIDEAVYRSKIHAIHEKFKAASPTHYYGGSKLVPQPKEVEVPSDKQE